MSNRLDGAWELLSGQPLPEGARDIKLLCDGQFLFAAFDTRTGGLLYAAGGTYRVGGNSYTEHLDFAGGSLDAGLVGRDQSFTIQLDGDTLTQTGTLTNGKPLAEVWKRMR